MRGVKHGVLTRLIHGDRPARDRSGGSAPALERSSTFVLDEAAESALITGAGLRGTDVYGRFGTETTRLAASLVADLEGARAGLVLASGMAAIHSTLTALVPAGGRLLVSGDVYGGTYSVAETDMRERGVRVLHFDACDLGAVETLLGEASETDLVWCESISNPLVKVTPVAELASLCQRAGAKLVVDATFAAGLAQHPLQLGADLVMHSATKYLNGHSDVIAGVVCGSEELIDRVFAASKRIGGCVDPMAAWLLARGLRTLPLRWARQCETAEMLASALAEHHAVRSVHHPSLQPEAARRGPLDSFGAMLSFELESGELAQRFVRSLELCAHAPSLGGTETLVCIPRRSSHTQLTDEEARDLGIVDGLLRVSVGLEDFADLWADIEHAIEASAAGR
jgi:cystathionine beta-lyase/cystathionine gamma-synthase